MAYTKEKTTLAFVPLCLEYLLFWRANKEKASTLPKKIIAHIVLYFSFQLNQAWDQQI